MRFGENRQRRSNAVSLDENYLGSDEASTQTTLVLNPTTHVAIKISVARSNKTSSASSSLNLASPSNSPSSL